MTMQSELRSILLETSARADYSQPLLQEQINEVNLVKLGELIDITQRRVRVLSHAFDCMREGTHKHPMQAFLHATECPEINEVPIGDDEFFSLLKAWGLLCEDATGKRQQRAAMAASDAFRRQFIGE